MLLQVMNIQYKLKDFIFKYAVVMYAVAMYVV